MYNKITVVGAGTWGTPPSALRKEPRAHGRDDRRGGGVLRERRSTSGSPARWRVRHRVLGSNDYDAAQGSELFIVTAGIARKPGCRATTGQDQPGIVKSVAEQIKRVAKDAMVIVVSNPLDAMCYVAGSTPGSRGSGSWAWPASSTPRGTGCSWPRRWRSRWRTCDGARGHGDTMVPLVSYTTVSASGDPAAGQGQAGRHRDRTRTAGPRSWRTSRPGRPTTPRARPRADAEAIVPTRSGCCRARPGCR